MKKLFLLAAVSFLASHLNAQHQHGAANEQMNRFPFEALIKSFESPERTEYQKPEKVLNYLGELKGKTVEDIGAGSGYFSVRLARQGAHVIAADVDERFIHYIRQRLPKENLDTTQVELRKISYDDCGLKTQEADKVLVVDTYHHIENRVEYFKHLKEGLKPDGLLYVIDFFKKELPVGPSVEHKISDEVVSKELREAGFSIVEINKTLLPYQYIVKAKL